MSDISFDGLAWAFWAFLTAALGALGLILQPIALVLKRGHRGRRHRGIGLVAGPAVVVLVGILGLTAAPRALDDVSWALPLVAIGLWFAVNRALLRGEPAVD
jgi:hypothetical protein